MQVTAIVPHWNRSDLLARLLASLQLQTRAFDRIIVADNGSTDDSPRVAEQAGVQFLPLGKNLGFAAAVNQALRATQTEWVAILNNDVTLAPDWVEEMLRGAAEKQAWFAAGKILSASDPTLLDGAFDEISRAACAYRCGAGKPDSPAWNRTRAIRFAPMTAALFRRSLFDEVGLLDEDFGSYMEDVDFGLRCALAGRSGVYIPTAVARHEGSATLGKWNKDTVRLLSRNQVLLARKHLHGQPKWPILAGQLLWGLVALRHCRWCAFVQGKTAGLRRRQVLNDHPQHDHPHLGETVRDVLLASERDILELQRETGFDAYWRTYFWLVRQ